MSILKRIGVCILNWNGGSVLQSCVESVQSALSDYRHTLVVVDNASTDASISILRQQQPKIAIIENAANVGFAAGNNVGAHYLLDRECSLLLFVNPDVRLTKDTVNELIRVITENETAGCVGGYGGQGRGACRNRPTALQEIVLYGPLRIVPWTKRLWQDHTAPQKEVNGAFETYAVGGACMLFRSQAFLDIEGFDERTFLYEEELIVGERLLSNGWKTLFAPDATFHHIGGYSTQQIFFRRRLHFIKSERYYLRQYIGWNWFAAGLLATYRYVEWLPYVSMSWALGRVRSRSRHTWLDYEMCVTRERRRAPGIETMVF